MDWRNDVAGKAAFMTLALPMDIDLNPSFPISYPAFYASSDMHQKKSTSMLASAAYAG